MLDSAAKPNIQRLKLALVLSIMIRRSLISPCCSNAVNAASMVLCGVHGRFYASRRVSKTPQSFPRLAIDRRYKERDVTEQYYADPLLKDPERLVQHAHEKERSAFRYALEQRDFVTAYQIYREQIDLRILNAAEVTSLVQVIGADALLRKHCRMEQPEALKTVLWQIVDDVRKDQVAHQIMIWVYVFGALQVWQDYNDAHKLWHYLETLPMRSFGAKERHKCIDGRVYGAMIKLMVAEGRPLSECQALCQKAMQSAGYRPTLLLDEAMIRAHFAAGDIGGSYKLMNKTIVEHRSMIRPGFFNAIIGFALDAHAVGVATEVFMKACSMKMVVYPSQVSRLLRAYADMSDSYDTAKLVIQKYRWLNHGKLQVEFINALLGVAFAQGGETKKVLQRVRECLQDMKHNQVEATSGTINTLLGGYIALGDMQLVQELMQTAEVTETSFRTMLKSLSKEPRADGLPDVQNIWSLFKQFREQEGSTMDGRDLAMVLRAAGRCGSEALTWAESLLPSHAPSLQEEELYDLQAELEAHQQGTFKYTSRPQRPRTYPAIANATIPEDLSSSHSSSVAAQSSFD